MCFFCCSLVSFWIGSSNMASGSSRILPAMKLDQLYEGDGDCNIAEEAPFNKVQKWVSFFWCGGQDMEPTLQEVGLFVLFEQWDWENWSVKNVEFNKQLVQLALFGAGSIQCSLHFFDLGSTALPAQSLLQEEQPGDFQVWPREKKLFLKWRTCFSLFFHICLDQFYWEVWPSQAFFRLLSLNWTGPSLYAHSGAPREGWSEATTGWLSVMQHLTGASGLAQQKLGHLIAMKSIQLLAMSFHDRIFWSDQFTIAIGCKTQPRQALGWKKKGSVHRVSAKECSWLKVTDEMRWKAKTDFLDLASVSQIEFGNGTTSHFDD